VIIEDIHCANPIFARAAGVNEVLEVAEPEAHVIQMHQLAE